MDNIKEKVLANGLKVITIDLPNFHSITNFLVIRSGSRYENASNNGIAHFLEHLVFKGTRSYNDTQVIAQTIEEIGGYFNAWTANDHTCYWNVVPRNQYQIGLKMPIELAFFPKLRAVDIERERDVIIEEIRRIQDDPATLVDDESGSVIFGSHPLGQSVIGTIETIKNMKHQQFIDYCQRYYFPSQAAFVIAGDISKLPINREVEQLTKELKSHPISKPEYFSGPSKKNLKVINRKTDQTHFIFGAVEPSLSLENADRYIGSVLNTVLGRGMSSRLFLNIREKKGLAYAIHSSIAAFEDTGALVVYGGVNTGKVDQTLSALEDEFKKLKEELVPVKELNKAKAMIVGSFDLAEDEPIELVKWYGTSMLLGGKDTFEQAKKKVNLVTDQQVREFTQKVFDTDRQTLTVIGPYPDEKIFRDFIKL